MENERYSEAPCLKTSLEITVRMKSISFELLKRVLFFSGLFAMNECRFEYLFRVMEALKKHWKTYAENCKKRGRKKEKEKTPETPSITAEKPNETQERKRKDKRTITTVEYNSSNSLQKESAAAAVFEFPESLNQQPETKKSVRENPSVKIGKMGEGSRFLSQLVHAVSVTSKCRCQLERESQPVGEVDSPNGKGSFIHRLNSLHLPAKLTSSTVCARFIHRLKELFPREETLHAGYLLVNKAGGDATLSLTEIDHY